MNTQTIELETDYLVVGCGAMGMAFVDTLLDESDANIIMVDRHAKPGGHWNVAYPFVTLHQPSNFYGVSSRELSKGHINEVGMNKGLFELASGAEVSAYFDDVMREKFLPSGRVQYFPMCEYSGNFEQDSAADYSFISKTCGTHYRVKVRKKIVNCTYLTATVPATHTPSYPIDPSLQFMPLNDLVKISEPPEGYTVIGGGKTGIDACLWLLENNVDPDRIRWIVPRDAWLLDRKNTQPGPDFFEYSIGTQAKQFEAIAAAESVTDLFDRLEAAGVLVRIYKDVRPQMFHGATVSQLELDALRRIKNVVRMGRVLRLDADKIVLERGEIPTSAKQLHVDCSARLIKDLAAVPVFNGKVITPQTLRSYQPVFSAALVAHVETSYEDESQKNRICTVVPLPNHDTDWIRMQFGLMMNQYNWSQDKALSKWVTNNRLDGFGALIRSVTKDDEKKQAILKRMRDAAIPAVTNLQKLIEQIDELPPEVVARYA
ncbi:MAG: NAD(P)/FAD-dependent oxidoreductase [Pseudomonadales bacterium]